MPVLQANMSPRPDWCELEQYSIIELAAGEEYAWQATHVANKVVVVEGQCHVDGRLVERGGTIDLPKGTYAVTTDQPATIVELAGHWGDDCGGSGIFGSARVDEPKDIGDPVDYPKHTNFDRHYHDCDEYWILVSGRGTASSENVLYDVGPGDCVATRMGHHHDLPLVEEPVLAVFFETTMRGERRRGHLWEHTHGPAKPAESE